MIGLIASSLAGCTTIQKGADRAGALACEHADQIRLGFTLTIQNASFINDPVIRQAVINGAQAGLLALQSCPVFVPPTGLQVQE